MKIIASPRPLSVTREGDSEYSETIIDGFAIQTFDSKQALSVSIKANEVMNLLQKCMKEYEKMKEEAAAAAAAALEAENGDDATTSKGNTKTKILAPKVRRPRKLKSIDEVSVAKIFARLQHNLCVCVFYCRQITGSHLLNVF